MGRAPLYGEPFSYYNRGMEKDLLKAIGILSTHIQSLEQRVQDMAGMIMNVDQKVKHLTFMIAQNAEPFDKVPKGESGMTMCEQCGARGHKDSMMSKSVPDGRDIRIYKLCKKCFYGKRKVGQTV